MKNKSRTPQSGRSAETIHPPLSDAHRAELDRRLDDLQKRPDAGRPWTELRDELLRR
ncbi:MAG: addiction module protein [Opitutaceae bacterium]